MSLAYTTGGQYVPMVNAKLLAKVIIGGVREEISLERLMKSAQEDIQREMIMAEKEGVDEQEKLVRLNNVIKSKKMRSQQMMNPTGTASSTAKAYSETITDMRQMQQAFASSSRPSPSMVSGYTAHASAESVGDAAYELIETEEMSTVQSERMYKKWQNRKC
jgi:hypothetical protein